MTNQSTSEQIAADHIQPPRNWSLGEGLVLWVLSVVFIFIVPAIFVIPFMGLAGESGETDVFQNKVVVLMSIAGILPAHLLTLFVALWVVKRNGSHGFFQTMGWTWNKIGPLSSVLLTMVFLAIASVIAAWFPQQENDFLKILKSSKYAIYVVSVIAIGTAPLVEEVVYRGVLFPALKKTHGAFFSILAVTTLFALVHVPQYWPSYSTIGVILSLSLLLTVVRNWTDSLLPCFVIHLVFNSLQVVSLLMFPEQILGTEKETLAILSDLPLGK
jgi:membrane protease YdiL (CAAX protease family)